MNMLLKFVLTMAISISIGAAAPAFGQSKPKVTPITNGQDTVGMSSIVGKKSPDMQLPIKVRSISVATVVRLMSEDLKSPMPPDATNRSEAEAAAEVLAKRFYDDLEKAGIKTSQSPEAEGVIELQLHYSNAPGKYVLLSVAKLNVNGQFTVGALVSQGNKTGVKEPENFIKTAAATMATTIVKNVAVE